VLDQEQPADQKKQDDCDAHQTRGLSRGCLVGRLVFKPMVMPIHLSLVWNQIPVSHKGSVWKQDKIRRAAT
jgi:hypothetical protein